MGKIKFLIVTWSLLILAFVLPLQIEAKTNEKTFPITQSVVEKAVISWLQTSGFRIHRALSSRQGIDFRAEKETERWHIVIYPQSALACYVKADWTGPSDPKAADPHQLLWDHISKQSHSPIPGNDTTDKTIPTDVRSRLEAVVCMRIVTDDGEKQVSGFFLEAREGLVISTAHDLMEFQEIIVVLDNGHEITGQVIQLNQRLDLALIRLESNPKMGILLTESRNLLNLGDRLYAIGCSANRRGKVTPGTVDGPPRRADNQLLWQVKMKILPGNSGSPVFDEQGRLVTVVKGRHRVKKSVGFLIPVETVIDFIKANIDYVQ